MSKRKPVKRANDEKISSYDPPTFKVKGLTEQNLAPKQGSGSYIGTDKSLKKD